MNDKTKILVVDDDTEICDLLKTFLVKQGFDVITANSGRDGIEKTKSEKPKVILLDIKMPDINGLETLKMIKEVAPKVSVIMTTGIVDMKVAQEAITQGAVDYFVKPFNLDPEESNLLARIRAVA